MTNLVAFVLNGIEVEAPSDLSLLLALRESLGICSVKDGCAPQGQCGCCTVLVDGDPRVACVTPVARVAGRVVTTVEGLSDSERSALADSFAATGGSQCGFCSPGIVMRMAAMIRKERTSPVDLDRALAAHLCRCTGWQSIYEAVGCAAAVATSGAPATSAPATAGSRIDRAEQRALLEGGTDQHVTTRVSLGEGGFADDTAPRDALVAIPLPPESAAQVEVIEAAGLRWVVAENLADARAKIGKVQGRRTTLDVRPPLVLPTLSDGGVRLATSWVEPAYLEPDASWCEPSGEPASPLANGGAFGGKEESIAPGAARRLADQFGRPVRVVFSREDTVRLGPKRPPIAARAMVTGEAARHSVIIKGSVARAGFEAFTKSYPWPYRLAAEIVAEPVDLPGPAASARLRGSGWAEQVVLVEGALDAAEIDRHTLLVDDRMAAALLDTCVLAPSGAVAGARVTIDPETGAVGGVEVRVGAGDPLDEIVLRSYAIGAVHMALGWVLTEGLAVDLVTGEVLDLTIRSFGIIRARDIPPVEVMILDELGPPLARSSDAVFAAVAAATWNAVSRDERTRPDQFPALSTRTSKRLRR